MGTYLSIPFVSRKVIQIEPGKPVLSSGKGEAVVNQDAANHVEKMPMTPIAEDKEDVEVIKSVVEKEEEVKGVAEKVVAEKVVTEKVVAEKVVTEKVVAEKLVEKVEVAKEVAKKIEEEMVISNLRISIPADDEPVASNPVVDESKVEARLPEFIGNMNSSSHAIKKFNRRHRKHQN